MRTLDELQPAWNKQLASNDGSSDPGVGIGCNSTRFKCSFYFGGQANAVLDAETGLTWWRQAGNVNAAGNWSTAIGHCAEFVVNNRSGWRLPTEPELRSLMDTSSQDAYQFPAGHPFIFLPPSNTVFWTSTADPANAANAIVVEFGTGFALGSRSSAKTSNFVPWCVRGPSTLSVD
jgi:hypothetical protein